MHIYIHACFDACMHTYRLYISIYTHDTEFCRITSAFQDAWHIWVLSAPGFALHPRLGPRTPGSSSSMGQRLDSQRQGCPYIEAVSLIWSMKLGRSRLHCIAWKSPDVMLNETRSRDSQGEAKSCFGGYSLLAVCLNNTHDVKATRSIQIINSAGARI